MVWQAQQPWILSGARESSDCRLAYDWGHAVLHKYRSSYGIDGHINMERVHPNQGPCELVICNEPKNWLPAIPNRRSPLVYEPILVVSTYMYLLSSQIRLHTKGFDQRRLELRFVQKCWYVCLDYPKVSFLRVFCQENIFWGGTAKIPQIYDYLDTDIFSHKRLPSHICIHEEPWWCNVRNILQSGTMDTVILGPSGNPRA